MGVVGVGDGGGGGGGGCGCGCGGVAFFAAAAPRTVLVLVLVPLLDPDRRPRRDGAGKTGGGVGGHVECSRAGFFLDGWQRLCSHEFAAQEALRK